MDDLTYRRSLLHRELDRTPDLDLSLSPITIREALDLVMYDDRIRRWRQRTIQYEPARAKPYVFLPGSPTQPWKFPGPSPTFRSYYRARKESGLDCVFAVISPLLGIVPEEYFPIVPRHASPGVDRVFHLSNNLPWSWRDYRDLVRHQGRALAVFIQDHLLLRDHLIMARAGTPSMDIARSANRLTNGALIIKTIKRPLWDRLGQQELTLWLRWAKQVRNLQRLEGSVQEQLPI